MNRLPFGYIKLRLAGRKANPMTNLIHHWSGDSMNFTWESLVLIVAGVILLRISGIGTIIVQPIIEYSLFKNCGGNFLNHTHRYRMDPNEIELH
ncbi:Transmembrane protein [Bacillus subtilis]